MRGRIFLIHWNPLEAQEYASPLRDDEWVVEVEAKNGSRAGKRILAEKPNAVVIYLSRLPLHGCETASALRGHRMGRDLPIIFVDGNQEAVEKTRALVPDALFTTQGKLSELLAKFSKTGARK